MNKNNKRIEQLKNKRTRKLVTSNALKEGQETILVWVLFKHKVIERINGKYKHVGTKEGQGLQVRNRIYLNNGTYKLVNAKTLSITRKFEEVPAWANDTLIEKYNKELQKQQEEKQ